MAALLRDAKRLLAAALASGQRGAADPDPLTPTELLTRQLAAEGKTPEPWQVDYLASRSRFRFVLAGRQTGKSHTNAAMLSADAARYPGSLSLVVSRSQFQAQEVLKRCIAACQWLPGVNVESSALEVRISRSGRAPSSIRALASTGDALRGWTIPERGTLYLDEGCFINEDAWTAVMPVISAHRARVVLTSSAGVLGHWSHSLWDDPDGKFTEWERFRVPSDSLSWTDKDFLASERNRLPADRYRQEHECEFRAVASGDPVFDPAHLRGMAAGLPDPDRHELNLDDLIRRLNGAS